MHSPSETTAPPTPDTGVSAAVTNPATGDITGQITFASPLDIERTARKARSAQATWAAAPLQKRLSVMRRFHDIVITECNQILDCIQRETGKSRRDAMTEVTTVLGTIRHYLAFSARYLGEERVRPPLIGLTSSRVSHQPHGLVGMITPWNYPFMLGIADAVPALIAGNAVLTKPSHLTPLSAHLAATLLNRAGLDPDLCQILDGGAEVAQAVINQVDYVGFTGSTATGRKVAVSAAERLIPCSLELGGKNAMLVLQGAKVNDAVEGLINGAFSNSGQSCITVERIYVHDSIYDQFVARAVERTQSVNLGYSEGWDVAMGSLISTDHAEKVAGHIDGAVERGAKVLVGGARRLDLGPAFVEPTLLAGVTDQMPIFADETFGPVASIYRVRDAAEAVELANASEYGLNASVWAGSVREGREVARQLRCGSVGVQATMLVYAVHAGTMGGMNASGIGRRHGRPGLLRFTQEQTITSSFGTGGGFETIPRLLTSARRAELLMHVLRIWRNIPGIR